MAAASSVRQLQESVDDALKELRRLRELMEKGVKGKPAPKGKPRAKPAPKPKPRARQASESDSDSDCSSDSDSDCSSDSDSDSDCSSEDELPSKPKGDNVLKCPQCEKDWITPRKCCPNCQAWACKCEDDNVHTWRKKTPCAKCGVKGKQRGVTRRVHKTKGKKSKKSSK